MRVLRTRRNVAHGLFRVPPVSCWWAPLPLPNGGDDELARSNHSQRSPQSPVTFSDECFLLPPSVANFVSFGQEDEEDSMSNSASEKEGWAESERDRSDSEGPVDLQEELIRVMNKAVQELELSWKSKLDSWYFRSSRHQVDSRTSVLFFPDVHDQLVVCTPIGGGPLSDAGYIFACGRGGTPRVCAHAPHRGDCHSTSVPCIGQNHGLGYQPTLQAKQDDSPSSQ